MQSQHIRGYWAYKLTVDQVSLIFEIKDLSCFGRKKEKKYGKFIDEYNELFNNGVSKKRFNSDSFKFKMQLKQLKLKAMYESILSSDAPNSKEEFKLMFGHEFKSDEDLKLIINKYDMLHDKLSVEDTTTDSEGLTFEETVQLIETSRGLPIDRNMKLYSFHVMYVNESKKWANG